MGFSISGAAVVVFVGLLIVVGMWVTAAANGFEDVTEAESAKADAVLERRNTAINITEATWNGSAVLGDLENTGVTQLRVSAMDVIVDGKHVADWSIVDTSDLLRSGEIANFTVSVSNQPSRIKVVTGSGIADTAGVT